jgi:hypothetical protein
VWGAVSVAVTIIFALSWPALIRAVQRRQWTLIPVPELTEAPPKRFNMLTQEDGDRVGIEFTRMNIPGYDPLP